MNERERRGWDDHKAHGTQELLDAPMAECPCRHGTQEAHDWLTGWAMRDRLEGYPYRRICLLPKEKDLE